MKWRPRTTRDLCLNTDLDFRGSSARPSTLGRGHVSRASGSDCKSTVFRVGVPTGIQAVGTMRVRFKSTVENRSAPVLLTATSSDFSSLLWKFVVCPSVEHSTGFMLAHATPLLKEKRNSLLSALPEDGQYPFFFHGSRAWPAFAADYHPVNPG